MRQCPKCAKRFLESNARICDVDGAVLDLLVVASERDRLVGTTILGRYAIDGVLGDGGMGVVYRAKDAATGTPFAVKVLRAEYSDEDDLVVRFEQEARAAAAINNPHIVEIYDWGSLPDNSRFFVMEFLDGRSLGDVMADMPRIPGTDRRRSLGEEFTIHIAMQVCEGLGAAHAIGVVHRDIKPDNFHLIRRDDDPYFVKILDFGIAKVQNSKAARTRTGSVFGTPHYMSPEQASGDRNMDSATDIYGLGVLMYEMIVGKVPFDAENLMGILTAHLYHAPTPPRVFPGCEGVSAGLEAIILRCLAKTREARYPSMRALYDDLARVRAGELITAGDEQEYTAPFDRATLASMQGDESATRPELPVPPEYRAAVPAPVQPSPTRPSIPAAMGPTSMKPQAPPGANTSARYATFDQNPIRFVAQSSVPGVVVDAAEGDPRDASRRLRRNVLLGVGVVSLGVSLGVLSFALLGDDAPAAPRVAAQPAPADAGARPVQPAAFVAPRAVTAPPPVRAVVASTVTIRAPEGVAATVSRRQGSAWLPLGVAPVQVVRPGAGEDVFRVEASGMDPAEVHVDARTPTEVRVALQRTARGTHHRRDRDDGGRAVTAPAAPSRGSNDGLRDPWGN